MFTRIYALSFALIVCLSSSLAASAISGRIVDNETGESLPFVTVQVLGTGKATSANADGQFRMITEPGPQILKFSHIGYYSVWDTLSVQDSLPGLEIRMIKTLVVVPGDVVYVRQYDPAQRIIIEAIRRKQEILNRLKSYNYDSYTKMVVRDNSKPDTSKIMMITETQAQSFWEHPDKYKEIITARKQSANLDATENLVSIGEMLNFNKNRLELGRYSVVSPVAEDALDFYNYYLYDSTYVDNRKVYKLEAEPKNQADPLVAGYLFIADSTFDVVDVDFGFNEGVRMSFVKNLHYRQRVAQFENQYWMPIEIRFTADVEISFPGIPDKMGFEVVASIYNYSFETKHDKEVFDEYVFEVAEEADKVDSNRWLLGQTIPLTSEEQHGYSYLDSVEQAPKPVTDYAAKAGVGALYMVTVGEYDIFRFNRVEGPFVGLGSNFGSYGRGLQLQVKSGYAFSPKLFEYRYGLRYQFPGDLKFALKGDVHRLVRQQWNVTQFIYNSTTEALFFKEDPVDYYYERGGVVGLDMMPIRHIQFEANLEAVKQYSLRNATDYSIFNREESYTENAQIHDGNLRAFSASLEFDSRRLWRNKGNDQKESTTQYTTIRVGSEYSSPDLLNSDFDYRKLYARIFRRQRTLGIGITSFTLFGGLSEGQLPRQKWYQFADYSGLLVGEDVTFTNLGTNRFVGDRVGYIFLRHDFDQYLFKKTGIPLLRSVPWTFEIYGGAFWTDFRGGDVTIGESRYKIAPKTYGEIGFALGNLTPFLSVFNLAAYFNWQISDYDVGKFTFGIGLKY